MVRVLRHNGLILVLLTALGTVAVADVVDAMRFHLQHCQNKHAQSGSFTVVHCYSPSCECCQELATRLKQCSHGESATFCYVPVESRGQGLPVYEVYDRNGQLKWEGESALDWIRRKLR